MGVRIISSIQLSLSNPIWPTSWLSQPVIPILTGDFQSWRLVQAMLYSNIAVSILNISDPSHHSSLAFLSPIQSFYESTLDEESPMYLTSNCPPKLSSYQAIQVNVKETGNYTLIGSSNFYMSSYLYANSFDPNNPKPAKCLAENVRCEDNRFRQNIQLRSTMIYILVITDKDDTGQRYFSTIAYGPSEVMFKRLSEYIYLVLSWFGNDKRTNRFVLLLFNEQILCPAMKQRIHRSLSPIISRIWHIIVSAMFQAVENGNTTTKPWE